MIPRERARALVAEFRMRAGPAARAVDLLTIAFRDVEAETGRAFIDRLDDLERERNKSNCRTAGVVQECAVILREYARERSAGR